MWNTFKYILFGLAWGCTWLVAAGVALSIWSPHAFEAFMRAYPYQALGAAAVGVASTFPARLYSMHRLPYWLRFLLHAGISLGVFFPVSFALNWIPYYPELIGVTVLEIMIGIGIWMAVWLVFFMISRSEARKINARVKELQHGANNDGR